MDAMAVETPTTSSPTTPRRKSTPLTRAPPASITLASARTSASTPLASIKSKGGFDKEAINKKYLKKAKAQECAFLTFLSDLDNDSDDDHSSSPTSDDESKRNHEDKLTGLCFITDSTHEGFCTMAVDEKVKASKDMASVDTDTTEVNPSVDALITELDVMTDTLVSQDKMLKRATCERKEFKDKLEITQKELEEAKKFVVVVSDEVECNECAFHMSCLF
jgi:hypothetical protein